ncbi:MAG TPA: SGNH/GDSL hydrolase family protein [Stellaceae bacterium]|nr:SGNH/GDSL hydrolase family protein [Stellaceae bacterium]
MAVEVQPISASGVRVGWPRLTGRRLLLLSALLNAALLLYPMAQRDDYRLPFGTTVSVSEIHPETGRAFIGKLSDPTLSSDKAPSSALLFLVESHAGGAIGRLQSYFGDSYLLRYLTSLWERKFPGDTYETWTALGPGNAVHEDIRKSGGGRYSVWQGYLYFSLPEGRTLAGNMRLAVVRPMFEPAQLTAIAGAVRAGLNIVIPVLAALLAAGLAAKLFGFAYRSSAFVRNTVPGVAISAALILVLGIGGETWLRASTPFTQQDVAWPTEFNPAYGWLFKPGAEVRWTNGLDFWSTQHANSLGFLDREPVVPKPAGTYRIALVGDSFVEGAQLPLEQKQQTILASLLNAGHPDRRYDVVALGYSGTGQSNQLAFFEYYKDKLKPDLVVLEFVANDFANNSALLEAIRNGWDPNHSPRLYIQPDGADGAYHRLPIDPNWAKYNVPGATEVERAEYIRGKSDFYKGQLDGWNPRETFMDYEFYRNKLPPAFTEALAATRDSFLEFEHDGERDGFPVLVVATDGLVSGAPFTDERKLNQIRRLQAILQDVHLPLLDLYPAFVARGGPEHARWAHDAHWNPTGHRWAAEEIYGYLKAHDLLQPHSAHAQNAAGDH